MRNKRLVWYLKMEKKIYERKFDFWKERSTIDAISKITRKIQDGFRRKEKKAAIYFINVKAYDKVNREKTLEQLEIMEIQDIMTEFIRELIGEIWNKVRVGWAISQSKQTDLGVPQ